MLGEASAEGGMVGVGEDPRPLELSVLPGVAEEEDEILNNDEDSDGLPLPAVLREEEAQRNSKEGTDDPPGEEVLIKTNDPLLAALANGWDKRPRHGKIPEKREFNVDRMTALEESLRGYGQTKSGSIICPKIRTNFDSINEAYEFYNIYSWESGFGIRHGRQRLNKQGSVTMKEFVCGCAGKPERENSNSVRCGCPAKMRLLRTKNHGYYVKEIETKHNHNLSQSYGETCHWPSHKHIDPFISAVIKELRKHNVPPCQVYSIVGRMFGRIENVPFTKKSLNNLCTKFSNEQADYDVMKTIALFAKMSEEDPEFQYLVKADSQTRTEIILWTNGRCRMQYKHFGDVVTFDTTYKTNKPSMPFGMFVGVNNHFQNIMFAGVLMRSESTDAFKWVFSKFLGLMGNNPPQTILTDQSAAMEGAIKSVFPWTNYRWCKWHVFLKSKEKLGELNDNKLFMDNYKRIVHQSLSTDEFETDWCDLIKKHNLQDHKWLSRLYDTRKKWARPYFIDIFCADQISTQRSESANHSLKAFLNGASSPINVFVEQYHKLLFARHEQESSEDWNTNNKQFKCRTSHPLEYHASKVYTRSMFYKFSDIFFDTEKYKIETEEAGAKYIARHRDYGDGLKWSNLSYEVLVNETKDFFVCQCGLFPNMGMLCCHALKVMKFLGVEEIPKGHIMKRWTPNARDILPKHLVGYQKDQRGLQNRSVRHSKLLVTALEALEIAKMDPCAFDIVNEGFNTMMAKLSPYDKRGREGPELLREPVKKKGRQELVRKKNCEYCNRTGHLMLNCPDIPRALGKNLNTQKKPRKRPTCGKCKESGHTSRGCSGMAKKIEKSILDDDS